MVQHRRADGALGRHRRVGAARPGRDSIGAARSAGAASAAGSTRLGAGFDVYPLRTSAAPHFAAGVKLDEARRDATRSRRRKSTTAMEGRPIALDATLEEYSEQPELRAVARRPTLRTLAAVEDAGLQRRPPVGHGHRPQRAARAATPASSPARPRTTSRSSARSRSRAAARCTGCASTATSSATTRTSPQVAFQPVALPALRGGAVRERVPGQRDRAQPRGPERHGLQPLHRHALLREQLPVQGAALQLPQLSTSDVPDDVQQDAATTRTSPCACAA